ncbi:DUF3791 domain-containing protein [Sporofaciens musculi]|jgi:hypothetical protein|uniref:DUF3791 domain-containing protein n=1 Tax=Sporofaciens musculi TaxID=2681861 RepID=UPI002FE6D8C4
MALRCVYDALSKKSDILSGYIVPEYESLHTQSKDYTQHLFMSRLSNGAVSSGTAAEMG